MKASKQINDGASAPAAEATEAMQVDDTLVVGVVIASVIAPLHGTLAGSRQRHHKSGRISRSRRGRARGVITPPAHTDVAGDRGHDRLSHRVYVIVRTSSCAHPLLDRTRMQRPSCRTTETQGRKRRNNDAAGALAA
ncbi:hypothetical protein EVAR_387_1 [Eumeta japonica]|uniref:Uncharacterized protein n=1 Tax=Eumeta variegata TaxID=151549 RepID=A0A4C1SA91_EUMVA|nr:hypothetical protein EVAR_387_1 [Eumeta japonica]